MNKIPGLVLLAAATLVIPCRASNPFKQKAPPTEMERLTDEALRVNIVRDDWGIAHVEGKTDADAVFGMIFAQCEDDFNRVETNYLNAMGRLAEAEGEKRIYQDLRMKLFVDPADLQKEYAASPEWLRKLMDAFADGANFYLAKHPEVKPRVIQRFEPWMALSFTEGSIGGDIERIDLGKLEAFYGQGGPQRLKPETAVGENVRPEGRTLQSWNGINSQAGGNSSEEDGIPQSGGKSSEGYGLQAVRPLPSNTAALAAEGSSDPEPTGSNGIAIAPQNTTQKHALLLINPHTSFYFRSELQMVSDEGLDAYGAVTWGQFFVYQGFNQRVGWMHTSSGVDAVDEYLEAVQPKNGHYSYKYGAADRPVIEKQITVPYKTDKGPAQKKFTVYYTQHGPVVREQDGKWVTIKLMQEPIKALSQSYLRTKAKNYQDYLKTMEFQANSSNNTIYADADGHIAYFHGNFIPRRDTRFDFTKPVDGSNPATDWQGLLTVEQSPHLLDPASGYVFNVNDSPWRGAGESSLRKQDFPAYVETGKESARTLHAIRILQGQHDFTLESLMAAAYDSYLPWFDKPLPALIKAWTDLPPSEAKTALAGQVATLREWNHRWGVDSVATSLAVFWGQEIAKVAATNYEDEFEAPVVPPEVALKALRAASDKLTADFGSSQIPWGDINRFQRLNGDIVPKFDDEQPSTPVGFTSSTWGSLASFGARPQPGTKKWYGTGGNSFVAVVEFGDKVRARAVTAGGESSHTRSWHFNDQIERYSTGNLREVYFYKEDWKGHTDKEYHPGGVVGSRFPTVKLPNPLKLNPLSRQ
jgi:acyl-homoserine lactone acylase PvdQ